MSRYIEGNQKRYICGIPGNYAVKSTGNNRIIARPETLEEAREYLDVPGAYDMPSEEYMISSAIQASYAFTRMKRNA
jgi:hypothetical protein